MNEACEAMVKGFNPLNQVFVFNLSKLKNSLDTPYISFNPLNQVFVFNLTPTIEKVTESKVF